jgi:hypothetical protein
MFWLTQGEKWLEPLKDWVKTAENNGVLAAYETDLNQLRLGLEKIGSKRLLRGKKIEFEKLKPYPLISKYRSLEAKSPRTNQGLKTDSGRKSNLVAGAGFEPTTFGL